MNAITQASSAEHIPRSPDRVTALAKRGRRQLWSHLVVSDVCLAILLVATVGCSWVGLHILAFTDPRLVSLFETNSGPLIMFTAVLVPLSFGLRASANVSHLVPGDIRLACSVLIAATVTMIAWMRQGKDGGLEVDAAVALIAFIMISSLLFRLILIAALRCKFIQDHTTKRTAIYGAGQVARRLRDEMTKHGERSLFVGLFEERRTPGRFDDAGVTISGSLQDLIELVRLGDVDDVIITLPRSSIERRRTIAALLQQYPVNVSVVTYFSSDLPEEHIDFAHHYSLGDAGLVQIHCQSIRDWGAFLKRTADRICSLILLIVLSPLFLFIAIAIKKNNPGPVFFRQTRHGLSNEEISVWKFRTMRVMEDGARVQQATKNDCRITSVGSILRKTSLDELPQLINVLKGEMSLVGPRPHAVAHNELYAGFINRYANRHQAKPGITG